MGDFDLAAINDRGVYAISIDDGSAASREFMREILDQGHTIQRMPRGEAVARHLAYLNETWPEFAALSRDGRGE